MEEKKEWGEKQRCKLEEHEALNKIAEEFAKADDVFAKEGFQYPRLNLEMGVGDEFVKKIPGHDKKECIWVDTEESLAKMASEILSTCKAIGVDTEYHDIDKVTSFNIP